MTRLIALAVLGLTFAVSPASAADYCKTVGVPKGCVARPGAVATPGVGAPGIGAAPGVGVGAPGAGAVNMGGPVNRAGHR